MIKFLADENFDNHILRGVLRRKQDIDIVRVQDVGLYSFDDESVLEAAATENRVLLTHDIKTIIAFAYDRVKRVY